MRHIDIGRIVAVFTGCYKYTPWVLVWALLGLWKGISKRRVWPFIISLLAGLLLAGSVPPFYRWRLMYVLPYLYLICALALSTTVRLHTLMIFLVLPSMAVTVGGRLVTAVIEWEGRDYRAFEHALHQMVPEGATVVMNDYAPYYAGLKKRWRMYLTSGFHMIDGGRDCIYLILTETADLDAWRRDWNLKYLGVAKTTGTQLRTTWRSNYHSEVFLATRRRIVYPCLEP